MAICIVSRFVLFCFQDALLLQSVRGPKNVVWAQFWTEHFSEFAIVCA